MVGDLIKTRERLIGAILLGNNLVNILASALATSVMVTAFNEAGVIYATILMTALVLVFAEVLPKTYALSDPDRMSMRVAPFIRVVVIAFAPVVSAVQWIVRRTLKAFGFDIDQIGDVLSPQDEIRSAIDLHHSEGSVVKRDKDMGVTQPDHFLNKVRGNVLLWKYLGEEHLRRSGLNYSVIRPGGLSNFPGGISVIDLQQGDAPDAQGLITREDVALVAIESLSNQGAVNKTFEVVNGDVVPGDDWRGRLALLKQDDTQLETPGASENQRMMPPASTPPAPPQ